MGQEAITGRRQFANRGRVHSVHTTGTDASFVDSRQQSVKTPRPRAGKDAGRPAAVSGDIAPSKTTKKQQASRQSTYADFSKSISQAAKSHAAELVKSGSHTEEQASDVSKDITSRAERISFLTKDIDKGSPARKAAIEQAAQRHIDSMHDAHPGLKNHIANAQKQRAK